MTAIQEHQESEVGLIPADWSVASLGDLGRCVRGVSYKPEHLLQAHGRSATTLLRSNNIRDDRVNFDDAQFVAGCKISEDQLARPFDIAICMSNGSKSLVGKSGVITPTHLALHPRLTVGAFCAIYRSPERYTAQIFKSQFFQSVIDVQLAGSAINNLKGSDIEGIRFPLPPDRERTKIAAILTTVDDKLGVIARQIKDSRILKQSLLQTFFSKGIGSKGVDGRWKQHTASVKLGSAEYPETWRLARMGDIAPVVRREIDVQSGNNYPELGLRSFGKGTFHKPALTAEQVGNKRLFLIKEGDLLLSNVFAWEGAVAVAGPTDDNRYGSHRYITCNVDPHIADVHFVARYLVTPAGLTSIGLASPGGAGRNKTLGLAALADIRIPLPPLVEQNAINAVLDCVEAKVATLQAKHELYRELKRGLMQKLLTGEWRVMVDSEMAG